MSGSKLTNKHSCKKNAFQMEGVFISSPDESRLFRQLTGQFFGEFLLRRFWLFGLRKTA
ncbi:hypothetical protein VCSRO113_1158 [Vibrio cholerae]|nr:hypothetical protein VCSRO210_1455 [Vibrio cholerae]GHY19480.1 hypothetical protein VCSRO113_1158 [Vibrio cholerae]